jgi:hypothetical protein
MTVLQPASWHDVLFMEDFLECASAAFDTIPVGVSVSVVDSMFRRWLVFAADGRSDPDWPADVLVSVLLPQETKLRDWLENLALREGREVEARPVTKTKRQTPNGKAR